MRLTRRYWTEERYFSNEFCSRVIHLGERLPAMEGKVRHDPKGDQRDSRVSWIGYGEETKWLFDDLNACAAQVNRSLWKFDITNTESIQYANYGCGQHYDWHTDQLPEPYEEGKRWAGLYRKLSVVVSLSEGAQYEGGDFLIEDPDRPPTETERRIKSVGALRSKGSIIVFPSFLYHKVAPVTSGARRSLVLWCLGPPFR